MLDLKKTGEFISNVRKEKGLTQKQLADEIGVSDKAISRWETGRGMPDTGTMPFLCEALGINVNELLSGERLSVEAYSGKAEDNMVKLIEDNEKIKKKSREDTVGTVIGVVILALFLIGIILFGMAKIAWFLDTPSLLVVSGVWLIVVGISGHLPDFFRGVKLAFSSRGLSEQDIQEPALRLEYAVDFGIKAMILSGAVTSIVSIVLVLGMLSDYSKLGPTLAVAVLSVFYSLLFCLFFMIVKGRVHKKA